MTTPKESGFFMPSEWHPHTATWMAWPGLEGAYIDAPMGPEEALKQAKVCYSEVAQTIARFETVNMLANKGSIKEAKAHCGPTVNIIEAKIDDGWFRDSGPSFVINDKGEVAGVNWVFNAYGNKYSHENDAKAAMFVLDHLGCKCFDCELVQEGGGIHVDGEGTVLVTEHCQLNKNRNPNLSKADVEKYLNDYIGVSKVIWLNGDIPYDETGGHIDGLACFIRPGVVMATTTRDKNHPDYDVLKANLETLKNSTDAKGRKLEVIEIDQPAEYIYTCAMNFYFANNSVVIPAYGFPEYDKYVLDLFKRTFTEREVIQLNTGVVLFGGGNIHCITQQQPAARNFNS
jgi:agmatine deiminase